MSWFSDVDTAAAIEVFALTQAYKEDVYENKVNLGVGAYRTDEGKPWVLPTVRSVEQQIANDVTLDHEYLPISGLDAYCKAGQNLMLGPDSPAILQNRVDSMQSLGGTGALFIGMTFLRKVLKLDTLYVSIPTWGNHKGMAKSIGFQLKEYRYWDDEKCALDIEGMIEDLRNAPAKSVIVLHMCAHNPSGMDPTPAQWKQIADVIKEKNHFPFFDSAYQGFTSGDLDKDAYSLRYFVQQEFECFAAQSFSKNFGLYNERVGNLIFVSQSVEALAALKSQMKTIVRQCWSNPPAHGCRVVTTILNNTALLEQWKCNIKTMADRIKLMRQLLHEKLKARGLTWDHVVAQNGMFSYTGLSARQSDYLIKEHHIYLLKSGRINMCGVTTKNVDYIADAILDAINNVRGDPKL